MRQRDTGLSPLVVEGLRFCVVAFLGGVGYQVALGFGSGQRIVGVFDAPALGVVLGSAFGYVLGGLVARLTFRAVQQTESALVGRSAEQLLAGFVGAVGGVLAAAALTWPMLLVGSARITAPLFLFVVITVGSLGYRLGLSRREGVLSILGGSGRLGQPRPSASSLPKVIDTSVAIDARVVDVIRAGFLHGTVLVAKPVLGELQAMADSADELRRAKGRRGLDALDTLRRERGVDLEVIPDEAPDVEEVDGKLVAISQARGAALLTLDTNLARVAAVAGCRVMNLHALALALRPPVTAGEHVVVLVTRPGKESGQGVGYLDDGTMVVVDRGRDRQGEEVEVVVTSVLVTGNGRLVFGRIADHAEPSAPAAPRTGGRPAVVPRPRAAEITARIAAAANRATRPDATRPDDARPDDAGPGADAGADATDAAGPTKDAAP